jgi:putative ATP-binding cassette transporter
MTNADTPNDARLDRQTWRRFVVAVGNFASSEVRGKAAALAATLLGLLLAISGLNVVNSYVGRDFMTAIEHRDRAGFLRQALLYVGVLGVSTAAAVLFRFAEERLGLLWRAWLTRQIVGSYLANRSYWRLTVDGRITNPDQRIAEDVRAFVTMTLSLSLMLLNGTVTVLAFSGVLWLISPTLFLVGVAYAIAGSAVTILVGRPLVRLNYRQSDCEADFRAGLIQVGDNAESIALLQREPELETRLSTRFDALVANMRRIIAVNRNVGFFTTGYNYMIQIIPALIVAPLFIRGNAEFGVITQASMAFVHLLGAFSLVVTQFQAISSYAAVLARLSRLAEVAQSGARAGGIVTVEEESRVAYEDLTLRDPRDGRVLVAQLAMEIPRGTRVLVRGTDAAAGPALLRATAGVWDAGEGRVIRPPLRQIAFLPERPYVPFGTLAEAVGVKGETAAATDPDLRSALASLGLEATVAGVDWASERDWLEVLALGEQQLVSIVRVLLARPRFVFLENLERTLDASRLGSVLRALTERSITYVSVGDGDAELSYHDGVLELGDAGRWRWTPVRGQEATA